LFITDDENVPEKYRKLIFHQRRLCPKDPLTEERWCDGQQAFYNSGVGVPRFVSGKNWYIEPFIEDKSDKRETKAVPNMAKV